MGARQAGRQWATFAWYASKADNCNNRQSSAQQRKRAREELGASEEEWHTHTAREVQTYAGCFASKQNEDDDDDGSLSCSGRFA